MLISIENAEHYVWGEICDGWHLLKREDISIIQERVPSRGAEEMHYHNTARQFFYIVAGEGTMILDEAEILLRKGDGIEIEPRVRHQFKNLSGQDVHFLVFSVPPTRGDRVNVASAGDGG